MLDENTKIKINGIEIDLSGADGTEIELSMPELTHTYNLQITVKVGSEADKNLAKFAKRKEL